jgi:hypothetical protein
MRACALLCIMIWEQCWDVSMLTRLSVRFEGPSQYVDCVWTFSSLSISSWMLHRVLKSGRWTLRAMNLLFPFKGVARVDNSFEPSDNAPSCTVSLDR